MSLRTALTPAVIAAATLDAGDRSMRGAGRSTWNVDDRDAAAEISNLLYDLLEAEMQTQPTQRTRLPGRPRKPPRMCVYGDGRKAVARGLCWAHRARAMRKNSKPMDAPIGRRKHTGCLVEGCEQEHSSKGYCKLHIARLRKLGTTDLPPPRPLLMHQHGTISCYEYGECRCAECREAHRLRMKATHREGGYKGPNPPHGTASMYHNYRCRCDPCKAAGKVANAAHRRRRLERQANAHAQPGVL